jgi:hypothetical protein
MFLKISSIPEELLALVHLKTAPISFAKALPSASLTASFSNRSDLFAAIAKTKFLIHNYLSF